MMTKGINNWSYQNNNCIVIKLSFPLISLNVIILSKDGETCWYFWSVGKNYVITEIQTQPVLFVISQPTIQSNTCKHHMCYVRTIVCELIISKTSVCTYPHHQEALFLQQYLSIYSCLPVYYCSWFPADDVIGAGLSEEVLCLSWSLTGRDTSIPLSVTEACRCQKRRRVISLLFNFISSTILFLQFNPLSSQVCGLTVSPFLWQIEILPSVLHLGEFWRGVIIFSGDDSVPASLRKCHND